MTTVGYGDTVPYSIFGRIVIIMTAFWGGFIISLLVVTVRRVFELNSKQSRAMHHLMLTRKAAASIIAAFRYFLARKKYLKSKKLKTPLV